MTQERQQAYLFRAGPIHFGHKPRRIEIYDGYVHIDCGCDRHLCYLDHAPERHPRTTVTRWNGEAWVSEHENVPQQIEWKPDLPRVASGL